VRPRQHAALPPLLQTPHISSSASALGGSDANEYDSDTSVFELRGGADTAASDSSDGDDDSPRSGVVATRTRSGQTRPFHESGTAGAASRSRSLSRRGSAAQSTAGGASHAGLDPEPPTDEGSPATSPPAVSLEGEADNNTPRSSHAGCPNCEDLRHEIAHRDAQIRTLSEQNALLLDQLPDYELGDPFPAAAPRPVQDTPNPFERRTATGTKSWADMDEEAPADGADIRERLDFGKEGATRDQANSDDGAWNEVGGDLERRTPKASDFAEECSVSAARRKAAARTRSSISGKERRAANQLKAAAEFQGTAQPNLAFVEISRGAIAALAKELREDGVAEEALTRAVEEAALACAPTTAKHSRDKDKWRGGRAVISRTQARKAFKSGKARRGGTHFLTLRVEIVGNWGPEDITDIAALPADEDLQASLNRTLRTWPRPGDRGQSAAPPTLWRGKAALSVGRQILTPGRVLFVDKPVITKAAAAIRRAGQTGQEKSTRPLDSKPLQAPANVPPSSPPPSSASIDVGAGVWGKTKLSKSLVLPPAEVSPGANHVAQASKAAPASTTPPEAPRPAPPPIPSTEAFNPTLLDFQTVICADDGKPFVLVSYAGIPHGIRRLGSAGGGRPGQQP
jgi:hypothetical protein